NIREINKIKKSQCTLLTTRIVINVFCDDRRKEWETQYSDKDLRLEVFICISTLFYFTLTKIRFFIILRSRENMHATLYFYRLLSA
ncbi:hypothetical protein, partial [Candidatus Symbiopectobacterium sp. NZEC135]|uniref:hypothetical protein n=1 Tax=Candidatus Symbiopectobacterium sp. NZEC135 TaxID=2820471 RepID=UPI0022260A12